MLKHQLQPRTHLINQADCKVPCKTHISKLLLVSPLMSTDTWRFACKSSSVTLVGSNSSTVRVNDFMPSCMTVLLGTTLAPMSDINKEHNTVSYLCHSCPHKLGMMTTTLYSCTKYLKGVATAGNSHTLSIQVVPPVR